MKKNIKYLSIIITAVLAITGCSKDFLNRPPEDAIAASEAYSSDDQVMQTTSLLYSKVWTDYASYADFNIASYRGGDAMKKWGSQENVWFSTTAGTGENGSSWKAFYNVIGQANTALKNIEQYAGSGVSPAIKNNALGEARFMRALAYRYLVMNWEAVPIITDNESVLGDATSVHRNTTQSVWRFIINEMRQAVDELPETPYGTNAGQGQAPGATSGRITKWTAEGMLARFYLSLAGVESSGGQRNQVYLDSAKYYAERVITLSGKSLLPNYKSLFLYPYNNNNESLFELQWMYIPGGGSNAPAGLDWWGYANVVISQFGPDNSIMNNDGWGGDQGATLWMLSQYDGFTLTVDGDTLRMTGATRDQRLHETFMLPGFEYPEITRTLAGVDQKPFIYPNNTFGSTFDGTIDNGHSQANIKKYITGQTKDVGGFSASMCYPNDTYMLRLAEMYLIYADAALGNQASTADATALDYFNKVHTRAGLPAVTDPLTFDAIFKEKVLEFGFEGMLWYLLIDLHYWNPQKAYDIIDGQYRGFYYITPNKFPNPTSWSFTTIPNSSEFHGLSDYATANDGNFYLPLPASEVTQAPNLLDDPVDYYAQ